jgi:serine/threonine protein kinase
MNRLPEPDPSTESELIEPLVEDFARRRRSGETISVEAYAAQHPAQAGELRRLLPAVAFLERNKPAFRGSGFSAEPRLETQSPIITRLGDNRLVREIGRGGMGIVYEAEQESLGRRVAIKILPARAHESPSSRERFHREAHVIAKLQHPHIVPIHFVGEQDGLPYYVMSLIDGAGLDRVLADPHASFPTEIAARARWAAELGLQAAGALAYAHGQNILHRDIKPSNLLLDSAGKVWLADFGLAKLVDDVSLTATGELPGTLRYLAPECLRSKPDARSDIYSLGLTLYELLVSRPAFSEQDRIRLLHQIDKHDLVPPGRLVSGLPREIETIILKASARDPAARYGSAAELADDLRLFLENRPIRGRRATVLERAISWSRRNPTAAGLAASSVVLGLLFAFFFRLFLLGPPFPPPDRGPPFDDGPPPRSKPFGRRPPPPPGRFDDRPPPPSGSFRRGPRPLPPDW